MGRSSEGVGGDGPRPVVDVVRKPAVPAGADNTAAVLPDVKKEQPMKEPQPPPVKGGVSEYYSA